MFNNLESVGSGKISFRIIATLLVITLTFANFAILGTYLGETRAVDAPESSGPAADNIKFDVCFDPNDETKKEIEAGINSDELVLYASIEVQNEGELENVKLDFTNSSFELKNNAIKNVLSVEPISVGNIKRLEIPIVAKKNKNYKLDLLNMESRVTLTGNYIDKKGNTTEINKDANAKITWKTEVTNEDAYLNAKVINNKSYNINGSNKKIVQILLTSKMEENKAPVKEENIRIDLPNLGVLPEQVKKRYRFWKRRI